MLYSENELNKRLRSGCGLYYFYAADEALVHTAAQKALKVLNEDDPETTVLDGPAPRVEEIVLAAGTISFFGGRPVRSWATACSSINPAAPPCRRWHAVGQTNAALSLLRARKPPCWTAAARTSFC